MSSLSSQLLESRKLYWGSVPFHWGLSLILIGHLGALIVPRGFELWNGAPLRLYLLEITGLALGLWAAFGVTVLIIRRHSSPRVRRVTTPMDTVVLLVIATQIVTGIWIAVGYRWGSYWGTSVFVPYMHSLFQFQPEVAYVDAAAAGAQAARPVVLRLPGRVPVQPVGAHHHPAAPVPLPPMAEGVANRQPPSAGFVTNDERVKAGRR